MSYDFIYYSGKMLRMPTKPTKPGLSRNPTAIEARAFADALEEYEREMKTYNENLKWYRSEAESLLNEFKGKVRAEYELSEASFNVIWSEAWERGHSSGLQEVYYQFERLHDFVIEYIKKLSSNT